jgi:hypothetical protein
VKTYAIYSNHREASRATIYVESGEHVAALPRRGDRVTIDGETYIVRAVDWDVYTEGERGHEYPQQCATILVKQI